MRTVLENDDLLVAVAVAAGHAQIVDFLGRSDGRDRAGLGRDGGDAIPGLPATVATTRSRAHVPAGASGSVAVPEGASSAASLLLTAAAAGDTAAVTAAIMRGDGGSRWVDREGNSALHVAAQQGQGDVVRLLLLDLAMALSRDDGYDVHARNRANCTPLHLAVLGASRMAGDGSSHVAVVRTLLEAGAAVDAPVRCSGWVQREIRAGVLRRSLSVSPADGTTLTPAQLASALDLPALVACFRGDSVSATSLADLAQPPATRPQLSRGGSAASAASDPRPKVEAADAAVSATRAPASAEITFPLPSPPGLASRRAMRRSSRSTESGTTVSDGGVGAVYGRPGDHVTVTTPHHAAGAGGLRPARSNPDVIRATGSATPTHSASVGGAGGQGWAAEGASAHAGGRRRSVTASPHAGGAAGEVHPHAHPPPHGGGRGRAASADADAWELAAFLRDHRLEAYAPHFERLGVETVADLATLEDGDCDGMGMKTLPRRRLRSGIVARFGSCRLTDSVGSAGKPPTGMASPSASAASVGVLSQSGSGSSHAPPLPSRSSSTHTHDGTASELWPADDARPGDSRGSRPLPDSLQSLTSPTSSALSPLNSSRDTLDVAGGGGGGGGGGGSASTSVDAPPSHAHLRTRSSYDTIGSNPQQARVTPRAGGGSGRGSVDPTRRSGGVGRSVDGVDDADDHEMLIKQAWAPTAFAASPAPLERDVMHSANYRPLAAAADAPPPRTMPARSPGTAGMAPGSVAAPAMSAPAFSGGGAAGKLPTRSHTIGHAPVMPPAPPLAHAALMPPPLYSPHAGMPFAAALHAPLDMTLTFASRHGHDEWRNWATDLNPDQVPMDSAFKRVPIEPSELPFDPDPDAQLGRGSYGVVYRSTYRGQLVAVKVCPAAMRTSPGSPSHDQTPPFAQPCAAGSHRGLWARSEAFGCARLGSSLSQRPLPCLPLCPGHPYGLVRGAGGGGDAQ